MQSQAKKGDFIMKMLYQNSVKRLACEVGTTDTCMVNRRSGTMGYDLADDSLRYAVCRLFMRSERLTKRYTKESYELRFARRKVYNKYKCIVPSAAAEIEGGWLQIFFTVDREGVKIKHITMLDYYPGAADENPA